MPDVTSTNEADWGPWQTDLPPVGSIFLLRLTPNYPVPSLTDDRKYKLTGIGRPNHGDFNLEKWDSGGWWGKHSWEMSSQPSFRVLRQMAVKAVVTPAGCLCKRCNALNAWAEPNQKDGSYLCFECRT